MVKLMVSGYTDGGILGLPGKTGGKGIEVFSFEPENGALRLLSQNGGSENPSFLACTPQGVLAVCEQVGTCFLDGYRWTEGGRRLEKGAGVAVPGTAMCHVTVWPGGKYASVSNYMTGDLAVIELADGWRPARIAEHRQHTGVGYDQAFRQEGPHIHSTLVSPGGAWLLAADLGLDRIFVYRIDPKTGRLTDGDTQLRVPEGEGPRHMAFSPDGRFLYLVTEMGSRVFAFAWKETEGRASFLQALPLLPEDFAGANLAADIHLSWDGRFLYASNRGADDIVAFAREQDSGRLRRIARHRLDGAGPRSFCLDPKGRFFAAACQGSGELLVYAMGEGGVPGRLLARAAVPQVSFCTTIL